AAHDSERCIARIDKPIMFDCYLLIEAELLDGVVFRVARRHDFADPIWPGRHGNTGWSLWATFTSPAEHVRANNVVRVEQDLALGSKPSASRTSGSGRSLTACSYGAHNAGLGVAMLTARRGLPNQLARDPLVETLGFRYRPELVETCRGGVAPESCSR